MTQSIFSFFILTFLLFPENAQSQFNTVHCDDISIIQYWLENTWGHLQKAQQDHVHQLEVWQIETSQNSLKVKTFEKMFGFVTKCEVEFASREDWQAFREFHLKSLEGE